MRKSIVLAGGSLVAALMTASATVAAAMPPGSYAGGGSVVYGPGMPTGEDYPPNAQPGQCFAKVLTPEVTDTYTEQVLVSPEKTVTQVIPGDCGFEDKTVVVREPSTELITIPATFRTVTETVVTRPGGLHTQTIPPVYETVTEQIKVRDGYTVWRPGASVAGYAGVACCGYSAPPPSAYAGMGAEPNAAYGGLPTRVLPTGEVLCLVAVPPEFRTITKQVLRSPGRTVDIPYPPETTVVSRQVVDVPAHVEKREIPGETRIVKVKICRPDQTTSANIPPEYRTVTKTRTVSPSRFEWKAIECQREAIRQEYAPPPPMPRYIPPAPPVVHHYHPPVVHHYVPPRPYMAPHRAKVCHETCTDTAAANIVPEGAPPAHAVEPVRAYSSAEVMPMQGGDRAVSNLQAALASKATTVAPTTAFSPARP